MTLVPSYGRDYKNGKEVKEAWEAGKDFTIADFFSKDDGRQINKTDAIKGGIKSVNIRFKKLQNIVVINVK
jgi:hypothetical protein